MIAFIVNKSLAVLLALSIAFNIYYALIVSYHRSQADFWKKKWEEASNFREWLDDQVKNRNKI
jgi:hypothetical protein